MPIPAAPPSAREVRLAVASLFSRHSSLVAWQIAFRWTQAWEAAGQRDLADAVIEERRAQLRACY